MTNREMMIKALKGEFDDWGAEEAVIYYNVNCPYFVSDSRCKCENDDKEPSREICSECKYKWLEMEVDE